MVDKGKMPNKFRDVSLGMNAESQHKSEEKYKLEFPSTTICGKKLNVIFSADSKAIKSIYPELSVSTGMLALFD